MAERTTLQDIPTNLPRTQDPPEHNTQTPAAVPTAEPLQTPDKEARDIPAKANPRVRLKTADPPKGNGLGQKKLAKANPKG